MLLLCSEAYNVKIIWYRERIILQEKSINVCWVKKLQGMKFMSWITKSRRTQRRVYNTYLKPSYALQLSSYCWRRWWVYNEKLWEPTHWNRVIFFIFPASIFDVEVAVRIAWSQSTSSSSSRSLSQTSWVDIFSVSKLQKSTQLKYFSPIA